MIRQDCNERFDISDYPPKKKQLCGYACQHEGSWNDKKMKQWSDYGRIQCLAFKSVFSQAAN